MLSLRKLFLLIFFSLPAAVSVSCSDPVSTGTHTPPQPGKSPKDGVFAKRGEGVFTYTKYEPLADKPVTLYYYIPSEGDVTEMPVLFSLHGAERDATIQRNAWKYFAEEFGFVVLAPEYSKDYYKENDYQFGGVFQSGGSTALNPQPKWTYNTIEAIFDYFKSETDNVSARYSMFGHSAGGQFVHRFLLAMPEARVDRAVAANSGSWTFPYSEGITGTDEAVYGWPYAVMNTPFATESALRSFFGKRLWIQLGTADTDTNDTSLPQGAAAAAQGAHRYEKGKFFYSESLRMAGEMNTACQFRLAEVEGVGHSTLRMVYGKSSSFDPANINDRGTNCAFDLLFN